MSEIKARVLFDFTPIESSDLGIVCGEIITVLDPECGNGWAKARNDSGLEGLIPGNYIEIIDIPEPSIPPPPLPNEYCDMNYHPPTMAKPSLATAPSMVSNEDSDWEDSDEEPAPVSRPVTNLDRSNTRASQAISVYSETKFGATRMPKSFLRTGGEDFLMASAKTPDKAEATVISKVVDGRELLLWKQPTSPKECKILRYEKQSKFKGMKTFISYTLESSFSNSPIQHRYKQFDWLHKQMIEKFPCIVIPPLPSPKVVGRYEDDFIESRRRGLQRWLDYVTRHPVLSESFLLKHFLTIADKNKWTSGKRAAENDPNKGGKFYFTLEAPEDEIIWENHSKRLDRVVTFQDSFEKSLKGVYETVVNFNKRQSGPICKEFIRIGQSLSAFSRSLSLSPDNDNDDAVLLHAVQMTGDKYEKIGKLFQEAGQKDSEMEENLDELIGVSKEIPPLLELSKCAVATVETGYRKSSETKVSLDMVENMDRNVRVITRSVDAELHWIQTQRKEHLRDAMKQYLGNQVALFSEITKILEDGLNNF